jgi:hypothetical protein
VALATARQDSALEFLLSLVAGAEEGIASDAIAALRMYRNDDRVRQLLEEAVRRRGDRGLGMIGTKKAGQEARPTRIET